MDRAELIELATTVKAASRVLAVSSSETKDAFLVRAATLLETHSEALLAINAAEVTSAIEAGLTATAIDRLRLTAARVSAMAAGLRQVQGLCDPVGTVVDTRTRPNGLVVKRVRVPLGVIGIIYENRPNVTSDAAGLCIKAGNAAFLRGSSSALATNRAIVTVLQEALVDAGLPKAAITLVEDTSHETAAAFMQLRGHIDCLIPRGGPSLIASMLENATVPYVLDGDGNCHAYVDETADLDMAVSIVANAKTQRPGVCNALETLLVHRDIAAVALPEIAFALDGVELRGCSRTREILTSATEATEDDFEREFLDLVLAIRVVDSLDEAIAHITRYGTGHSETIITSSDQHANAFISRVDAAAVLVNASSRFIDGDELGLGAEVGISTQKLHARGPMGVEELTCAKWVVTGEGQIRQ